MASAYAGVQWILPNKKYKIIKIHYTLMDPTVW